MGSREVRGATPRLSPLSSKRWFSVPNCQLHREVFEDGKGWGHRTDLVFIWVSLLSLPRPRASPLWFQLPISQMGKLGHRLGYMTKDQEWRPRIHTWLTTLRTGALTEPWLLHSALLPEPSSHSSQRDHFKISVSQNGLTRTRFIILF